MPLNRITAPNLAALYEKAAATFADLPAFATRRGPDDWEPLSFQRLFERGRDLATGLIDLGVEARSHVGLLADNRVEWILSDCAVQLCGAADVPRGQDTTPDEIAFIYAHAGCSVILVENAALQKRLLSVRDKLPDLREIILLDPDAEPAPGVHPFASVEERGHRLRADGDRRVEERMTDLRPDDLFTLIYTSGTTGEPKGVMLTHANMVSQIENIPLDLTYRDRVLSILPVWHIFERVFEMITIAAGCCTYYTDKRRLADDLLAVEPTFMGSAPRLWEALHRRIRKRVAASHPVRRALFHTARFLSHHYQGSVFFLTGRRLLLEPPRPVRRAVLTLLHALRWLLLLPWYGFFNAAVLERLRQGVGGSLKGTVSGGGALPLEVDRFFNYLGIPVLEGYGLTETSPVLAVRTPASLVIGTVGPPIPGTELRIIDPETDDVLFPDPSRADAGRGRRGEICVRGPQVMRGYYRNPQATGRVLRDGWFRTGDLGLMTWNGCLRILGRCKETVVLSNGENFEPGPIEMRLRQSPLIDHCMVVGQDRRHAGLLVVPDLDGLRTAGFGIHDLAAAAGDEVVRRRIEQEIRRRISAENGFKSHERIRVFRLVPEPFEVGRELTNLQKIRRHVVEERHASLIEEMYPGAGDNGGSRG
ncbi:MAG: long-chain fatty acid--CoA ligase [Puniceicoccaceae bacterium]|nr:MAG: long-chain fatty acid--CoA ligase [Puniceicoccaceae bacterium]